MGGGSPAQKRAPPLRDDGSWIGRAADPEGSPNRAHHARIAAIALDEHRDLSLLDDLPMPDGMAKGMDEEAVRAGKKLGLIMLERYQVATDVTSADAQARGLKYIKARRELRKGRRDHQGPLRRSRVQMD